MLSPEQLRSILAYDAETGLFTWLTERGNFVRPGRIAGTITPDGYLRIVINKKSYAAHRLAWAHVTGDWPNLIIDHIDRDKLNNRFSNLRLVTPKGNAANRRRGEVPYGSHEVRQVLARRPLVMPRGKDLSDADLSRFLAKISKDEISGCWLWTASIDVGGYGVFGLGLKTFKAHRVAFEHYVGPVSKDLELDHLCKVRNCVNPSHLEPVTKIVNMRRSDVWRKAAEFNTSKTHCKRGHPYSGDNLYLDKTNGKRQCRQCRRLADRKSKKSAGRQEAVRAYGREWMRKYRASRRPAPDA